MEGKHKVPPIIQHHTIDETGRALYPLVLFLATGNLSIELMKSTGDVSLSFLQHFWQSRQAQQRMGLTGNWQKPGEGQGVVVSGQLLIQLLLVFPWAACFTCLSVFAACFGCLVWCEYGNLVPRPFERQWFHFGFYSATDIATSKTLECVCSVKGTAWG